MQLRSRSEDSLRPWQDPHGSALEHSKRQGNDGSVCLDSVPGCSRSETCAGLPENVRFDPSRLPAKLIHRAVQPKRAAALCDAPREICRQLVITAAQPERIVALDGIFGLLLPAKRGGAGEAVIGGVEALDKADRGGTLRIEDLFSVEIVSEAQVHACKAFKVLEKVERSTMTVVADGKSFVLEAHLTAATLVGLEPCLRDQRPQFGRPAMNKLGAKFDRFPTDVLCEDPAANPVLRFKHKDP